MTGYDSKRQMAADKMQEPWNEDEWRRNNWRCGHGWLRGEQCEICNAAQPPSEWAGIKAILDEYGLQAIDFVADFKAALAQPAQEPVTWAGVDFDISTAPPQRPWVGLTDADIAEVVDTTCQYTGGYEEYLIKKAEQKIRSMNI